jgi:hypothetical protein
MRVVLEALMVFLIVKAAVAGVRVEMVYLPQILLAEAVVD